MAYASFLISRHKLTDFCCMKLGTFTAAHIVVRQRDPPSGLLLTLLGIVSCASEHSIFPYFEHISLRYTASRPTG